MSTFNSKYLVFCYTITNIYTLMKLIQFMKDVYYLLLKINNFKTLNEFLNETTCNTFRFLNIFEIQILKTHLIFDLLLYYEIH